MFIDKNIICYIEILDIKIVILKTCKIPVVEVLFVLLINIIFYSESIILSRYAFLQRLFIGLMKVFLVMLYLPSIVSF